MKTGQLTFFCGKMGAGKSTLATQLAADTGAVLLSEDAWLSALYPGQIKSLQDYMDCAERLKSPMASLVQSILRKGTDVVMDFPANTPQQRSWFKQIFVPIKAPHQLILIDASDEVCLQQIAQRRTAQPERAATDTPEMFAQVSKHFKPPADEEGFAVTTWA